MKDMKLFVFAAGILLMGLLNSCDSEKDYPVTITFSNASAVDSVFKSDSYSLNGKVDAGGPIESIQFYRSSPNNSTTQDSSIQIAEAKLQNLPHDTCNFTVSIPTITYSQTIWVVVTEKNGHTFSSMYKLNVRPSNINIYNNIPMGGWDSNNGSAADLDAGKPYGSSALATVGSIIDIFFDGGKLASTDLDATVLYANLYPTGARFADTGTRFATTTFTAAVFDGFKADDSFKAMTGTLSSISIKVGDIVFFQTKGGKKGLLKVVSMTDPLGDLVLNEKIQQ